MHIYFSSMFFLFGLIFGSFYNVVGYRVSKKESLLFPSSHCPKCNHELAWYELIPVLSYIIQLGKCRNCKVKISPFYMIFELITGILFLLSYLVFGLSIKTIIAIFFSSILVIITVSDLIYFIIEDIVLIIGGILLLIVLFIFFGITDLGFNFLLAFKGLGISILSGLIPFIIMLIIKLFGDFIFKKESMGGGDIKLMFIFGLVLGPINAVATIFLASFIALPVSLIILKLKNSHEIPFGPFLSLGALILFFTQFDIINLFMI